MNLHEDIRNKALQLGFSHCGFAKAEPLESLRPFYTKFTGQKQHAGMDYLERYTEQRLHPELLLPGVRTVIALLMNYYPEEVIPEKNNFIIAKYAYGGDYAPFIKEQLKRLAAFLDSSVPGSRSRIFIDSGPVLEKTWAQRCGVGWQGKHTVVINEREGSFFFIGIILTTHHLEPDEPERDHCGNCTRCIDACPTDALHTPYQLEINRCLSYHTIVNRGEVPSAIRGRFRHRIFGCDICQDVCPFNRVAKPHRESHFLPLPALMALRKPEWLSMKEEEFMGIFCHSEIKRTGYQTLKRNMELAGETPEPAEN
ncbi:MAG: tRNA epoxyqueuosine(34) reductase QueG [Bacteroidota bacterium]